MKLTYHQYKIARWSHSIRGNQYTNCHGTFTVENIERLRAIEQAEKEFDRKCQELCEKYGCKMEDTLPKRSPKTDLSLAYDAFGTKTERDYFNDAFGITGEE